jgi:uncharacterized protein (DUF1697 family)
MLGMGKGLKRAIAICEQVGATLSNTGGSVGEDSGWDRDFAPGEQRRQIANVTLPVAPLGFFLHNPRMALVVFLRGVNVGGQRNFRPSILARKLSDYDVVNVGAAGTFVVRRPGSRAKFRAALLRRLPFEAHVLLCQGRDLMRLEMENPFGPEPYPSDVVRFVSILSKAGGVRASLPVAFPSDAEWLVRVMASEGQFVFGMYRRHMKTIGYLGQIDKLYGAPATTRNRNTIAAILGILKGQSNT